MSIASRTVSAEALEEGRRLYEQTTVPIQAVADMLGISKSTLNHRIPVWGWTRRRDRIPRSSPPAPASVPDAAAPASAPEAFSRAGLVARLIARIENEIAAIERLVTRDGLAAGADGAADTERAARTLGLLVRTLRELAAIERAASDAPDNEQEASRDADTYRRELADTLERLLASRAAG